MATPPYPYPGPMMFRVTVKAFGKEKQVDISAHTPEQAQLAGNAIFRGECDFTVERIEDSK